MPAARIHHVYPLSPLQQGLLTHYTGQRTGGVDIVQIVMNLPEALPAGAFEQSWQWLARRHAILRTTFQTGNATHPPAQEVHDQVRVDFTWQDWRNLSAAAHNEKWTRLMAEDRARGIHLAEAPLWRVTVVQSADSEHRVIFTFHHLLLDARALLVLMPELFAACEAYQAGHAPVAGEVRPYRDYIDWIETTDFTPSARYWGEALAGFRTPTPLPLATGGPAGATGAHGPCDRTMQLDAARTDVLKNFARAHDLTLNTLVQGAWALLLGRCSGEEEVVFGAVRACRHASVPGAENLVGPLINTVPLRVSLASRVRVVEWLRKLRQQWVQLRPHEHIALAAIRSWSELPAGTPLFETVVSYQEPGWDDVLRARGGVWADRSFAVHNQINHPLALDAAGGSRLQLRLNFDPGRFTVASIDRMLGHLTTLLDGMVAYPDRFLANLPLLTAEEEDRLLRHWSAAPADFGAPSCVHDQFARQAALHPGALAVADEQGALTYAELDHAATTLASRLRAHGAAPGVFVGVCVQPSAGMVVALLAVLKTGGAYVPMDPAYPAERLAFIVGDAGVRLLVTEGRNSPLFSAPDLRRVFLDEPAGPTDGGVRSAAARPASLDDPAYLIYTSGSTGVPKGVSIRHRNLANLVAWHRQAYAVTTADRATQIASPAFDACVWELWPYLTAGASIHIPDPEVRLSPTQLVGWLTQRNITLSFLPTPLAEALLEEVWPPRSSLRALLTGGDRLRRWPGHRLPCALFNHYGPTEGTVVATWAEVPPEPDGQAFPAIGRPMANAEVYVLDDHRQPVPIGVPGELHLGGAGLADGYHRRLELTEEKFVPHLFDHLGDRKLYRTGDRVRWRDDGQLDYLGRLDQQVKIRGHRIEPGEIEVALAKHPAVREALVVAREDAANEPQLAAYFLPRPGHPTPTAASLAEMLHRRLPSYMVPVSFVPLEAWPLTAHGKIDRTALPAPTRAGSTARPVVAPRPGIESTIARIWSEVLGCPIPGACDDFFELGGHSLRAAQVITRLNAALHLPLTVRDLFEHSTIASLATAIGRRPAGTRPIAPAAPELVTQP